MRLKAYMGNDVDWFKGGVEIQYKSRYEREMEGATSKR
jgi:hypothetical protein